MSFFQEPLVIVLGIILLSVTISLIITFWQEKRRKERLKNIQGTYANDGIWGS